MPVDIIVGLAFGSEGKGRVAEHLIVDRTYDAIVRTGGPNAGHSVWNPDRTKQYAFQVIPCVGMSDPDVKLVLGAGSQIDLEIFKREIQWLESEGISTHERIIVDPYASIIDLRHKMAESGGENACAWIRNGKDPAECKNYDRLHGCSNCPEHAPDLNDIIGSTRHGGGAALVEKIQRKGKMRHAKDIDMLQPYLCDTRVSEFLNNVERAGGNILLEGAQGMMLSIHHGYYPYTTSRSTGPAQWLMEAGLSPLTVRDIVGVTRLYPIRVAGNSGPSKGEEISWDIISERIGKHVIESTTVSKRVRRVFEFSGDEFHYACDICRPSILAINFLDYFYPSIGDDMCADMREIIAGIGAGQLFVDSLLGVKDTSYPLGDMTIEQFNSSIDRLVDVLDIITSEKIPIYLMGYGKGYNEVIKNTHIL